MRKTLMLVSIVGLMSSCGSVENSQVITPKEVKAVINRHFKDVSVNQKKEEKKEREIDASLEKVPLKYALRAFCITERVVCDTSSLPDKSPLISLKFRGSSQDFLKILQEKTGLRWKRVDNTLFFSFPKRITIKAVNLPLSEFLKLLSDKLGGYSIIIGKGVDLKAPITVIAENKPINQVIEEAFSNLGYSVTIDNNTKTLKIDGWISKTISLPSFFSNAKTANLSSTASVYGGGSSGSNTSSSLQMAFLQGMKIEFENTIRNILGNEGKYSVNYDLGELYVEGRAKNVKEVESYVKRLNRKLSKQVLIDIAVIEQRIDNSKTYGIDWAGLYKDLTENNIKEVTVSQSALGATNGVLNIEIKGAKFDSVIKAIENSGKAKIITNFRLSVPNYDIATIASATTRQFITQIQREINPQTGRETYSTTTQQVSEGSALFVRPIIREDGKVDIIIAPTISSILGVDENSYGDITLKNPIVAQRNSPLRLIIRPDRTYIVGGIMTSFISGDKTGVPYLTDIPVIGGAFGKTQESNKNSVIYVVLRTHIEEN